MNWNGIAGAFALLTGLMDMFFGGPTATNLLLVLLGALACFTWYKGDKQRKKKYKFSREKLTRNFPVAIINFNALRSFLVFSPMALQPNLQEIKNSIDTALAMSLKKEIDAHIPDLDEDDAALFTSLCQFVWIQGEPLLLIYNPEACGLYKTGHHLRVLKHLESIGLYPLRPLDM